MSTDSLHTSRDSHVMATTDSQGGKKPRLWMDGSFDLLHCGHLAAIQKAKELSASLVVGLQPDSDVLKHKGPPVFSQEERYRLMRGVKWVDQVVESAPYGTRVETLDKYHCDYCVHGDDLTLLTNPQDVLYDLGERLKFVPRGIGMSTTDRITRILERTKAPAEYGDESSPTPRQSLSKDGSSRFLVSGMALQTFSDGNRSPKSGERIVYVAGAFDMFHAGHLDFLEKAACEGDYLIVGVFSDDIVSWYKGSIYPIVPLPERALQLLAFKCVSDVILAPPYTVTSDMLRHLKIDLVCHGKTPIKENQDGFDPYQEAKEEGKFKILDSKNSLRSQTIVERVIDRRVDYEVRNKKKLEKERKARENFKQVVH